MTAKQKLKMGGVTPVTLRMLSMDRLTNAAHKLAIRARHNAIPMRIQTTRNVTADCKQSLSLQVKVFPISDAQCVLGDP